MFSLKYIAIILLCCSNFFAAAQDINFSQFYELPLLRNPALAGLYKGDFRATAAFRNQWSSVTVPYVSQALSAELKFAVSQNSNNYIAAGVQVTNDVAGDSKLGKTQILPVLTYHQSLRDDEDTYLSIGFVGGPVQQRFDPSKLSFDDQFVNGSYSATNPTQQTFNGTNISYFDGSAGLLFSTAVANDVKLYLGAALFHFNKPKVAFDRTQDVVLNRKLGVNAGLSAPVGEYNKFSIYLDHFRQGGNRQTQGGFLYTRGLVNDYEDETVDLTLGALLRWNDAVIPIVKLDYYNLGIGASYDANISKLAAASNLRGGFEITLSYRNFLNIRATSLDKTRCPVAF